MFCFKYIAEQGRETGIRNEYCNNDGFDNASDKLLVMTYEIL